MKVLEFTTTETQINISKCTFKRKIGMWGRKQVSNKELEPSTWFTAMPMTTKGGPQRLI